MRATHCDWSEDKEIKKKKRKKKRNTKGSSASHYSSISQYFAVCEVTLMAKLSTSYMLNIECYNCETM